jgi:hypothetical protein
MGASMNKPTTGALAAASEKERAGRDTRPYHERRREMPHCPECLSPDCYSVNCDERHERE